MAHTPHGFIGKIINSNILVVDRYIHIGQAVGNDKCFKWAIADVGGNWKVKANVILVRRLGIVMDKNSRNLEHACWKH